MKQSKLLLVFCVAALLSLLQGCAVLFVAGTAATAVALHDRRDISTQMTDAKLELAINTTLIQQDNLKDNARIRVFAVNGNVLLVGQVPTRELKAEVDALARKQKGVNSVYNELAIRQPIPISQRSEDSWISTKARADLIANEEADFARLKIITEDQRVYLLGVLNESEAATATEICRHVSGVKEVIRVFDVVSD